MDAPSLANSRAAALPMPCVLPQTSALFPVNERSIIHVLFTAKKNNSGNIDEEIDKYIEHAYFWLIKS